jgi:hypothetical protein
MLCGAKGVTIDPISYESSARTAEMQRRADVIQ